jgi:hypothetical protein
MTRAPLRDAADVGQALRVGATDADDAPMHREQYVFLAVELNRDALRHLDSRAAIYGGVRVGERAPVEPEEGKEPMVCVEYDFLTAHDADDFMPGALAR